jgi:type IV pilus assembly protein PilW
MKTASTFRDRPATQRGLTIVEMMIAMTLAMLVVGVVATVFAGTSRNRGDLERSSRLAENASYALDVLSEDLRLAGFYGQMVFTGVTWQVPNPCAVELGNHGWASAPAFTAPVAVSGYAAADIAPACIDEVGHRIPGTAAVVVRRLSTDTTPIASATGAPFMQVSSCNADFPTGNPTWVYSDKPGDFTLRRLGCASTADVRQVYVHTYFVSSCNDCSADSTPTLKRAELTAAGITITPLVEGVENLQIAYGFDTNGDGNSDVFRAALSGDVGAADNDWSNVVATRLYVLARASEADGYDNNARRIDMGPLGVVTMPNDGYRRVVQTGTVRLNNPAGLRETP